MSDFDPKRRELFHTVGAVLGVPLVAGDVIIETPQGMIAQDGLGNELWFVDHNRVNLDDMVNGARPGAIVRCDGDPAECVRVHLRRKT